MRAALTFLFLTPALALATPDLVDHQPTGGVFGEPDNVTQRDPAVPREDEPVTLWIKTGYSFSYDNVAVYYTTDGSTPSGTRGAPSGSTQVLRSSSGQVTFVRNEPTGLGNLDWWRATLPAGTRSYGQTVRYRIGAWASGGGIEVWANNSGCSDNVCNDPNNTPTTFSFTNRLAWPGQGSAFTNHTVGYPPVHIWKEEAVVGNGRMTVMLDQNGSFYDVYYPSAGNVQGMGTKNEGYVDGIDTFPPGLPPGHRGQMNMNLAFLGIRADGKTYWLTNQTGSDYANVTQRYRPNTNTVETSARLVGGGNNITVQQVDFTPKSGFPFLGVWPGGLTIKRALLTNNSATPETVNVYFFADFALNGGDILDTMSADPSRGAMVSLDNTYRLTSTTGEYNPTSFGNYEKNVSVSLAASLKLVDAVGGATGSAAPDSWRDTSGDNDQGWIGVKVTLQPGQTREVNVAIAGGFDGFAGATGTYTSQVRPVLDWFLSNSMLAAEQATDAYWQAWLDEGTTVDFPDDRYDTLFTRSKLATALHLDAKTGAVVAGMHNGAYPFCWPRDAVYAAVTLTRAGHFDEAEEVYRFLREVAFRATDTFGKGFWYQKYTMDGYQVWTAPQVDETAVVPWGVRFHYNATGDLGWTNQQWPMVREAGFASSQDSTIDTRLFYDDPVRLMHSNNVWEDQWDRFVYSNANVVRGLRDAAFLAGLAGQGSDAGTFNFRAGEVTQGLRDRLTWNGENCDVSLLGIVYPFEVFSPVDADSIKTIGRINGTVADRNGQLKPLVRTSGEWNGLIDRYWGDTYWGGGPWYLSTLWYGCYYAMRQDHEPGRGGIDLHRSKIDNLIGRLGPVGFGAEQIAPSNSLLYPGQTDFSLQAAWPNAWESMSYFMDSVMLFLDFSPEAAQNRFRIEPKLPTGWGSLTYRNLRMAGHRIDVTVSETATSVQAAYTNRTGQAVTATSVLRIPAGVKPGVVTVNNRQLPFTWDRATGRVSVTAPLAAGVGALTTVRVGIVRKVGDQPGT